jgi:hypothetical protein
MLLQIKLDFYSLIYVGIGIGVLLGLIPLIFGLKKRKQKYAVFGFFGSVIGGAILGVFLSLPIAAIFTWLILRSSKPIEANVVNESPEDVSTNNSEDS